MRGGGGCFPTTRKTTLPIFLAKKCRVSARRNSPGPFKSNLFETRGVNGEEGRSGTLFANPGDDLNQTRNASLRMVGWVRLNGAMKLDGFRQLLIDRGHFLLLMASHIFLT